MVLSSSNYGFLLALIGAGGIPAIHIGAGDPEGSETGNIGDVYLRTDGTFGNSIYSKQANSGLATGWVPLGSHVTDDVSAQANGITSIFTLNASAKAFHSTTAGIEMHVFWNGIRQREGSANDFVASESGGAGTGFDTITFNFVPALGDTILVDFLRK